jgi:predicted CXXCH cytochrome family protein
VVRPALERVGFLRCNEAALRGPSKRWTQLFLWLIAPLFLGLAGGCERAAVLATDSGGATGDTSGPTAAVTLDLGGAAVPDGAWVTLVPGGRDALVGAEGTATFQNIDPGEYTALASAPGFATERAPLTVTAADGGRATVALAALADDTATIDGLLRDANRDPVADAVVLVDDTPWGTTDENGAFFLEDIEPGAHDLRITPPTGAAFADWVSPGLNLAAGATAELDLTLPSISPEGSKHVGSAVCASCHLGQGSDWADSAHARAQRTVAEITHDDPDGLAARVALGRTALLNPTVAGAAILLESIDDDTWSATIIDAQGDSVGPYDVGAVYGGHRRATTLIAQDGDRRLVLPAMWLLPMGADDHAVASLEPAWTQAWFDADGGVHAPTEAADFDLHCAGCHATGHRLQEDTAGWSLADRDETGEPELGVGCEACHGAGQGHFAADDVQRALTILNPERLPASQQVDVCSGCHQRLSTDDHPFSATPGWPVDTDGDALDPARPASEQAEDGSDTWLDLGASRVAGDTVGELRASPHMNNDNGYAGSCGDCHVPHGRAEDTLLRAPVGDNELCTGCHNTRFPYLAAEQAHANHAESSDGPWQSNSCTACHMPRLSTRAATDPVSEAGDTHAHTLWSGRPDAALAEFDAAGTDDLNAGQVPVSPCLDCHLQQAEISDCDCPTGDPGSRSTYESLQESWDAWQAGTR